MDSYRERLIYFGRPTIFFPYHSLNQGIVEAASLCGSHWPRHYRILDPNDEMLQKVYNNLKAMGNDDCFLIFKLIAQSCDHMIGASFTDGCLGAGVYHELEAFFDTYPFRRGRLMTAWTVVPQRKESGIRTGYKYIVYNHNDIDSVKNMHKVLSIEATRERIRNGVM
jgi:hypothetical protein